MRVTTSCSGFGNEDVRGLEFQTHALCALDDLKCQKFMYEAGRLSGGEVKSYPDVCQAQLRLVI